MQGEAWTAERVAFLIELWAAGETAAAIGGRLGGVSRSAVLEKIFRLRLGISGAGSKSESQRNARGRVERGRPRSQTKSSERIVLVQGVESIMASKSLVGYVRVSTSQQGRSGLGIEAQKEALERFAMAEGFTLGRVFVEVETGKGADAIERRPQLAAALGEARRQRCSVGVAKLDRLSRDVHFISGLALSKFGI
jgi:hypothetical protein